MTLTNTPSPAPLVPTLNGGAIPTNFRPYSDITSFTYRTGMTHMALVENMRHWIQKSLIPFLNDNFSEMEGSWEIQVNSLLAAVNATLEAQTADNAQAISDALTAISEADIAITDPAIMAVLNTSNSAVRAWLNDHYGSGAVVTPEAVLEAYTVADSVLKAQLDADYDAKGTGQAIRDEFANLLARNIIMAPPPLGAGVEDTTALMAVIAPAADSGATVYLQRGTYLCNLNLPAHFQQVKIIGSGMRGTILKAADKTKPVVKFNGGSGQVGGGGLYECGLTSADGAVAEGIALAFSGTTGCSARAVRISGSFAEGVRFWNERSGDFTEMNTFEGDISGATTPVLYAVDNGVESFHGSGLVGNTTINITNNTQYVVNIDKNALPYNAPMSFTVWFISTAARLFRIGAVNRASGRSPSFYGTIRCENNSGQTGYDAAISDGNTAVLYQGGVSWLGVGSTRLGRLRLCRKIGYDGGTVWGELFPVTTDAALKNTPTNIATEFEGGSMHLVAVTISGPNYEFHAILAVQRSRFNGDQGFITELGRTQFLDSNGKGAPTFAFTTGGVVQASNPNYDSTFHAYVTVTNMGGGYNHTLLSQDTLV